MARVGTFGSDPKVASLLSCQARWRDDRTVRGRHSTLTVGVALASLALGLAPSGAAPLPPLQHLRPGQHADIVQPVPVTVVFVGLEPGPGPTDIDAARLLASQLPANRVVDRTTRYYERTGDYEGRLEPATIGLTYRYEYRSVFAGPAFEQAFFDHLSSVAVGPRPGGTIYQQAYSADPLAAQPIGESWKLDATDTERWLAANAGPLLGVDTTRPTVFFLNWFGRPDFRFHTYGFSAQRPDVPVALGNTHDGQMIAWGGTPADAVDTPLGRTARVWFYDLSAGPDAGTANWLLRPADINGDGVADERIPPIWEYGTDHWFRPFDDLTADLGKLLRFVAVDALIGSSPIYDPATSEPLLADTIQLDLNLFAGIPGHDPAEFVHTDALRSTLGRLDPTRVFTVDSQTRPLAGPVNDAYDCWQRASTPAPLRCFGNRSHVKDDPATLEYEPDASALDLFFGAHGNQYLDGTRYEAPVALFDLPFERLGPLLGFASLRAPNIPDWSYVFTSAVPFFFTLDTTTRTLGHEVGHHVGLSHVHDTYDPVLDEDVSAADGPYFFMLAGTETYTAMSYLPNTDEFGQFDRDHMARWQLAARLDNANRILGDVVRSPRYAKVSGTVTQADAEAGKALAALQAWDLPAAASAAADAYRLVLAAAGGAGVTVEPFSGVADQGPGAGAIAGATDPRDRMIPRPAGFAPGTPYMR